MPIYFISDLHLEPERPDITRAFLEFMTNSAPRASALYILGDFFEVWVGDDFTSDFVTTIKQSLAQLTSQGIPVFLMHGNRDFLLGEQFYRDTGCSVLPDPIVIHVNDEPILLCHGDHLCTGDDAYIAFRKQVRNPGWQRMFLSKSLEERITIARDLRAQSQQQMQTKDPALLDVTPSEIVPFMKQHRVRTLIHGHTHRPGIHHFEIDGEPAQRIVLGDWYDQSSLLEVSNDHFNLINHPHP